MSKLGVIVESNTTGYQNIKPLANGFQINRLVKKIQIGTICSEHACEAFRVDLNDPNIHKRSLDKEHTLIFAWTHLEKPIV